MLAVFKHRINKNCTEKANFNYQLNQNTLLLCSFASPNWPSKLFYYWNGWKMKNHFFCRVCKRLMRNFFFTLVWLASSLWCFLFWTVVSQFKKLFAKWHTSRDFGFFRRVLIRRVFHGRPFPSCSKWAVHCGVSELNLLSQIKYKINGFPKISISNNCDLRELASISYYSIKELGLHWISRR